MRCFARSRTTAARLVSPSSVCCVRVVFSETRLPSVTARFARAIASSSSPSPDRGSARESRARRTASSRARASAVVACVVVGVVSRMKKKLLAPRVIKMMINDDAPSRRRRRAPSRSRRSRRRSCRRASSRRRASRRDVSSSSRNRNQIKSRGEASSDDRSVRSRRGVEVVESDIGKLVYSQQRSRRGRCRRTRERGTRTAVRYVYFTNITMSFDVAYHVSIVKNHPCVAMWLINSSTTHMRTSISSCP